MQKNRIIYIVVVLVIALVIIGLAKTRNSKIDKNEVQASNTTDTTTAVTEKPQVKPEPALKASPESAAISAAAKKDRYVFVTFYRKDDAASKKMQAAMKPVQAKFSRRASFVSVDVDSPIQQELVLQYGADRSPIPLTLVIAPNGAVTAGYPSEITNTDFSSAFVSNGMASVIKVLQDRKLAAVCIQGPRTKNNKKSLATAEELKAAPELGGAVEIVKINPSDPAEFRFIKECKIDARSTDAQLLVLAPPGKLVGKFASTDTMDTIMTTLKSALGGGGCGGGSCGAGGCGP
ncbi:hypothetical protein LLG46_04320 [bacterium]|nr:hypothetical protein [bacterium]